MMRTRRIIFLAVAVLFYTLGAYQVWSEARPVDGAETPAGPARQERIERFHAEIAVHADASLTVTESIRVVAIGKQIKRGIFRVLPVRYRKKDGTCLTVQFEVVGVLKDGEPEPYHVVVQGDYKRVYIGKKDVFLKPGVYTYTLVYRAVRQPGLHDNDELYWNVIGHGWMFEIARASARVKLPKGVSAEKVRYVAYTGPKGARGKAYRARIDEGGRICFTTTGKLRKAEGLTVSVTWPKGSATRPEKE